MDKTLISFSKSVMYPDELHRRNLRILTLKLIKLVLELNI